MKNTKPIETAVNADLRGSWQALQRAAQSARRIAAQTGTAVVVMRNGALEYLYPQSELMTNRVQESAAEYGKPE